MNLPALIFTFIVYGLFLAVYSGGDGEAEEFPTFSAPPIEFRDVPNGCGGFLDCTEYLADIVVNFVLGIVYAVLVLVEIITLLAQLLILAIQNAFTGLNGAPAWLNAGILAFFGITFAIAVYRMVRKGDADAS